MELERRIGLGCMRLSAAYPADLDSAEALSVIYEEEKGHVAIGKRWFDWLCARRGLPPRETWRRLVRRHFKGQVKPPFNEAARSAAGLPPSFYADLAEGPTG